MYINFYYTLRRFIEDSETKNSYSNGLCNNCFIYRPFLCDWVVRPPMYFTCPPSV